VTDTNDVRQLLGIRVRVTTSSPQPDVVGVLHGVRPDTGALTVYFESGERLTIPEYVSVEDARTACELCAVLVNRLFDGGVCAACTRQRAKAARRVYKSAVCRNCGAASAYRSGVRGDDNLLCTACHLARGYKPLDPLAVRDSKPRADGQQRLVCSVRASASTDCAGQVKPRGAHVLCDAHSGKGVKR